MSIIIPVFNTAPYLSTCVESVLGQAYERIEILLINDGSEDESAQIMTALAQKYPLIRTFHFPRNAGHPSRARNEGILQAKGKYVAFVDSDDWIERDLVQESVRVMEEKNCDLMYCAYLIFSDTCHRKEKQWTFQNHRHKDTGAYAFNSGNVHPDFWINFNSGACFKMYRKGFLTQHRLIFTPYYFEDLFFSIKTFLLAERIYYLHEPWYHYRTERTYIHKNRGATHSLRQCMQGLEGLRETLFWIVKKNLLGKGKEAFSFVAFQQSLRWLRDNLPPRTLPIYKVALHDFFTELTKLSLRFTYFNKAEKKIFQQILREGITNYEELTESLGIENALKME